MDNYVIEQLPISQISASKQQPFIALVEKILAAKATNPSADTTALEAKIDEMVYKLYNLTNDEIKIIANEKNAK